MEIEEGAPDDASLSSEKKAVQLSIAATLLSHPSTTIKYALLINRAKQVLSLVCSHCTRILTFQLPTSYAPDMPAELKERFCMLQLQPETDH